MYKHQIPLKILHGIIIGVFSNSKSINKNLYILPSCNFEYHPIKFNFTYNVITFCLSEMYCKLLYTNPLRTPKTKLSTKNDPIMIKLIK